MRKFTEPTARNLLRPPLIMGVSLYGLMVLSFLILVLVILLPRTGFGSAVTCAATFGGYIGLRIMSKFARLGWEESLFFPIERLGWKKTGKLSWKWSRSEIEVKSPDLLDPSELIYEKELVRERLKDLKSGTSLYLQVSVSEDGGTICSGSKQGELFTGFCFEDDCLVYSLSTLPVVTDPLWMTGLLRRLKPPFNVHVRIDGLDFLSSKRRVEGSRRRNARDPSRISDIDSDVTFEEASDVLQGLSRGDEQLVAITVVVSSIVPQPELDPSLFTLEKNGQLAMLSVLGARKRTFRSFWVRTVTASDLIPNLLDPKEEGARILTTQNQMPLYFSPQDSRLEALHWLVVGASGSGKSFFTGLVLTRMVESNIPMSVLFVDHNRSFRRIVKHRRALYLEPIDLQEMGAELEGLVKELDREGAVVGIELSDLKASDKRAAAEKLLNRVESFLRGRSTTHPVYLVLDECWNFLRDEPVLVQRAFREFRKLNGAVIAITQSLSDFVTTSTGQTIFQNAPVRILLRQGEDLGPFRAALALNDMELARLRLLKQVKGQFSECIIKTPFLSRLGRLYPTPDEHELLRTDNIRAELIRQAQRLRTNAPSLLEVEAQCL